MLTPDVLTGVGLNPHLDLVNPGEYEEKLQGLGFPTGTNVQGQKSAVIRYIKLYGIIDNVEPRRKRDFKLTVSDASGTNIKTIQLNVKLQ